MLLVQVLEGKSEGLHLGGIEERDDRAIWGKKQRIDLREATTNRQTKTVEEYVQDFEILVG